MQYTKIAAAVLIALSLTACGQSGLSAGAKGSEALETGEKNELDIKKDQSKASSVKQTRDMLGSTLFANALTAAAPVTGLNPATFFDNTFHGDLVRPHALAGVEAELKRLGFGAAEGTITAAQIAAATAERDRVPFTIAAGDQKFFQTWISAGFIAGWGIIDEIDQAKGKECVAEGELVESASL